MLRIDQSVPDKIHFLRQIIEIETEKAYWKLELEYPGHLTFKVSEKKLDSTWLDIKSKQWTSVLYEELRQRCRPDQYIRFGKYGETKFLYREISIEDLAGPSEIWQKYHNQQFIDPILGYFDYTVMRGIHKHYRADIVEVAEHYSDHYHAGYYYAL